MRRRCRSTSTWSKPGFAPGAIAMKPTLARLTSGAFAGACDLVLAPGVERVVDRQRQLELTVVTQVQQMEALRHGEQTARLRCAVAVRVLGVGGVVGVRALALGDLEHLLSGDVEELGVLVDEVLDQPGAGDP